jgi:hypothetical protein
VNVPHQFPQIGVLLTQNGFVPVLKQMPMPVVPAIEGLSLTGQQPSHDRGDGHGSAFKQQVEMVGDQRPCIPWRMRFRQNEFQPLQKFIPIIVISEDLTPFNPPRHNMVYCTRRIDSCFAWHG